MKYIHKIPSFTVRKQDHVPQNLALHLPRSTNVYFGGLTQGPFSFFTAQIQMISKKLKPYSRLL